ncbi:MAG: DNA polymerase III subunit gamma/tau [Deltaproteobacteria bacterium]|nr:DNA polymerase III subunit gamma/tau [Deltaproteobacteria bacterium]
MEYLVLARKWRPQVFEDVVGQDHVARTLKNAIRYNRIAHAFIFSGPRGVGKTSVARILSKAINCKDGPTETPCNVCSNCREITEGVSLDVREIDGASNRGIDEIRELRENIKFSPINSRYKVYIIDEVHMLTKEAFNALLKTLEEPPPHVVFIFATTEIYKVPATILSRCQHFDFKRVSIRQIGENLGKIAAAENITISDKGLFWIAQSGDGSIRDAQSVFDQVISYGGTDIKDGDIEELLGLKDRRFLFDISEAILSRDAGRSLKVIDECYYSGVDIKQFFQMLLRHFRNLLLMKITTGGSSLSDVPDDEVDRLKHQAGLATRETHQRLLDILMAEEETMRRSLDPRLTLECLAVKMAYLEPIVPLDDIISKLEHLEKQLGPNRPAERRTIPPNHDLPDPMDRDPHKGAGNDAIGDPNLWNDYSAFINRKDPVLYSKIRSGTLRSFENKSVSIGFPEGYIFYDDLVEPSVLARLTELSRDFFREDVSVTIEKMRRTSDNAAGAVPHAGERTRNINDIKNEALNHPLVQKVMNVFDGAELCEVIARDKDQ